MKKKIAQTSKGECFCFLNIMSFFWSLSRSTMKSVIKTFQGTEWNKDDLYAKTIAL